MEYSVEIHPDAVEQLKEIPKDKRKKILKKIKKLSRDPFPHNSKNLKENPKFYRIRFSEWRIIYTVKKEKLLILVVRVGNRKEIYKALDSLPEVLPLILDILEKK